MSGNQKLRSFVYGLGALGGTVALFATVLEQFYGEEKQRGSRLHQLNAEMNPRDPSPSHLPWDYNWDRREPEYLKQDTNNNYRSGALSSATRHIILIRHGQYNLEGKTDQERYLTDLGREQARLTGVRLANLSYPYTMMIHSNMTRAIETADILKESLPSVPVLPADGILREGSPIKPEPRVSSWKPEHYYIQDGARIEAAFRKYFHRADVNQIKDSYEIVVCHANVIRYLVCRALQFPPEAWLRISLKHASITWLTIRPDGRVSCRSLGESGHFPPEMLTTS